MPEISGERLENEMGMSVTVIPEGRKIEEREKERNEEEGVSVTANRWPQQETLALLQIRSDMDVAFRDSGSKSHLWNQVSRRMAELGYDRSAKKCKEKFENIYKYHRRLKNCSYGNPNGKMYRFFDQLEAIDHHQMSLPSSAPELLDTAVKDPKFGVNPISSIPEKIPQTAIPLSVSFDSSPITPSTSSTSFSGSESEGARKRKRKWADFFDRLTKSVLEKQEDLQRKFLEALDKYERERLARDEAWKMQEMARIKREHELLLQERSRSTAKDAAILAFLQKISEQGMFSEASGKIPVNQGQEISKFSGASGKIAENPGQEMSIVLWKEKDSAENSPSRWPKEEVEVLIRIRSNMELDYQSTGSKGPLWEHISRAMKKIGYNRNAKRCKEKWENINKYYRRVKDSNKQRPIDSKTCPYFNLLDAFYNRKNKKLDNTSESAGCNLRPEDLLMHMVNHNHSGKQKQEPIVLKQEQGKLIMDRELSQNGGDHNRNEDVEREEGDFQTDVGGPSPVGVIELGLGASVREGRLIQ